MEATLREMQQDERDEARQAEAAASVESAADGFHKRLASLRERLDDLVLQVAVVQSELEENGATAALHEVQELWIILYSVNRRFNGLLA